MGKAILTLATKRYQKLPAWVMTLLACLMVLSFLFVGETAVSILFSIVGTLFFLVKMGSMFSFDQVVAMFDNIYVMLTMAGAPGFILYFWLKYYEKRPFSSLGFVKKIWKSEILKGWLVGTSLIIISFLTSYLLGGLSLVSVDFRPLTLLQILSLMPFWFLQGGTEELLTRGWLLPVIKSRTNLIIAIALSSSLFGILHIGNHHVTFLSILSISLSGVLMALYMIKTDNIWGVAGLHGAWNFTQGNIFGVAVSGTNAGSSLFRFQINPNSPEWISGGAFGTEGSLIASIVLMIGILILMKQLRQEKTL
ncbi:CPBP family intramembrane metalloprotease [Streptococcus iniae]|uniref:CPBP family intramembrane glutamic endopeptidase n=1 Tax=Streptococcus iniae TaxID=1346 RepID=UPI0008D8DD83|nr:type II CAAX endopeptidase family protein [Streptococcus iniae]OHX27059.1 CAAX protease family protein [Streptococcus iniae]RLV28557.1 CPBP family intramembrane metalloprotease [Streptococcus iniae]